MAIWDFLRSQPQTETKASLAGSVAVMNPGQAVWSKRDYASFAKEGYAQNVVVYQSVNKIAEAIASVKWTAFRGDTEITESPLLDLMARPNLMQSGREFMQEYVGYYMLAGNSYVERVEVAGEVREMYNLRPDRMKIIASNMGIPAAYVYNVGGREVKWPVDLKTGLSDIRHLKSFHPTDDWYGLSPVEAGAYSVDQHNEAMRWLQALLQNSARPSGALVSSAPLSDKAFSDLKAQLESQYQGSGNAGRPMLLENGLDWKSMGLSPTDMGIIEAKFSAARDVALTFGVPPQLLGIPGDNTYSNYQEARLAFWEDTVIPLIQLIAGDLTEWLGEGFGGLELRPDLDQVPAIVDKRATLWEMVEKSNNLTINEKREAIGYEPIPGGDVLLVNASQIPLEDAGLTESIDMEAVKRITGYDTKAD